MDELRMMCMCVIFFFTISLLAEIGVCHLDGACADVGAGVCAIVDAFGGGEEGGGHADDQEGHGGDCQEVRGFF